MTTAPRMIERWFPCEEVSANSTKGWGSGNSEANLFTWFAKRPLAQAKAAVITSLLPWPEDPAEQRRLQALVRSALPYHDDPDGRDAAHDELVAELEKYFPEGATMLDPFSGRAMIPLEAARLGVRATGIDYSPVATLAGKLLADYPLRNWDDEPPLTFDGTDLPGDQLDLDAVGQQRLLRDVEAVLRIVGDRYEESMDEFYPKVDGKRPWGYLWAVTLPCEECSNRFPLTGSLVLRHPLPKNNDPGQSYRITADPDTGSFDVIVHDGPPNASPTLVTVQGRRGKSAVCPFPNCHHVHPIDVHTRLMQDGLAEDRLLIAADLDDEFAKVFRTPTIEEYEAAVAANAALADEKGFAPGLPAVPSEEIPAGNHHTVRPSKYGYKTYGELCNGRQTLGFIRLCRIIADIGEQMRQAEASDEYASALPAYAASVIVRRLRQSTRGARLQARRGGNAHPGDLFVNESCIGFGYDHFETGPGLGPGTWRSLAKDSLRTLRGQLERAGGTPARIERGSALALPLKDGSLDAVVTDPPYNAMIDYTDASDLFYVWLKRALHTTQPALTISAHPAGVQEKAEEIIIKDSFKAADDHRTPEFYNEKLAAAFAEARRVISPGGVVTIVFGHNDPDVWRGLLQIITDAGLVLTGTWPALTEKGGGTGSANIVTTMTLACRAAPENRPDGRSSIVAAAVREEVGQRIPLWEQAGLALPDQQMAAYGPAMEIVGRYHQILNNKAEAEPPEKFLLIARQAVEDAADIRIDGLPLGTFDVRTRFALSWVRQHRRQVSDAAQERWQRLTAQAVAGTELDLDGIVVKAKSGVRLAYGSEIDTTANRDTSIIDVVFALARAGKSSTAAAEILDATGRANDEYLWSAVGEMARQLAEADADGEVYTWQTRHKREIANAASNAATTRAAEERQEKAAGYQSSIFEQGAHQ
ncbi:DUF1156 domain-containing protein [Candidatus Poriferisocius sp.]|uniref:DUF1156 domain-containing protein n=1 Tax=Candidatus Poriferisocius sp. TaxID=3101276 RepID=UPI003B026923